MDDALQLRANASALEQGLLDEEEHALLARIRSAPDFIRYEHAKKQEFLELALAD